MEKILTRKSNNHQRFKSNLSQFSKNSTMFQFLPRLVDQNESRNSLPNPQNPSPKHLPKKTFVHEEIYEIVNSFHAHSLPHTSPATLGHIPLLLKYTLFHYYFCLFLIVSSSRFPLVAKLKFVPNFFPKFKTCDEALSRNSFVTRASQDVNVLAVLGL